MWFFVADGEKIKSVGGDEGSKGDSLAKPPRNLPTEAVGHPLTLRPQPKSLRNMEQIQLFN